MAALDMTRRSIALLLSRVAMATALAATLQLSACDEPPADDDKFAKVTIKDKEFKLELALDDTKRFKGLSDRKEIPKDGGMLFVFAQRDVEVHEFVMRDCPVPIDIIFLDSSGRVTAKHKMKVEEPRKPDEPETKDPSDDKYEQRLKRYSSKYPAQFVIELAGDTLDTLEVKEGDKVKLDTVALKKRAKAKGQK